MDQLDPKIPAGVAEVRATCALIGWINAPPESERAYNGGHVFLLIPSGIILLSLC